MTLRSASYRVAHARSQIACLNETSSIALLVPSMPGADEVLPWLRKIDETRRYSNFGPLSKLLEDELARLSGAAHAVCVSSCTLGLELALGACGLADGGVVLLPALTFPATASAVVRSGFKPVFGDVDRGTLVLTPEIACRAASETRVDAVLTVALHGQAHDAQAWDAFTAKTGIPVLIDAAGAAGHQKAGSTTSAVFSLHATKTLAVGEGGFVAAAQGALADRIRVRSNFGFQSGEVQSIGTNAKFSEYHAAVGLAALQGWPDRVARRQAIYDAYAAALDRPELRGQATLATRSAASSNLSVRIEGGVSDQHVELLAERGIETRRWYWPPLHRHSAFAHVPRVGTLEATEEISGRLLGLPFHLDLKAGDIARVSDSLCQIVR